MATLNADFWKKNAWIVDGVVTTAIKGEHVDWVSDTWHLYGHIGGPEEWKTLDEIDEGGGVTFSYENGISYSGPSPSWPGQPAVITFQEFLDQADNTEFADIGATRAGVKATIKGDMKKVLEFWAANRTGNPPPIAYDKNTEAQNVTDVTNFLNDTNYWGEKNISRDARLAAAMYNVYARELEYEYLHSLAPTKYSIERATTENTPLTTKPADIDDEAKVWIYQYVHGPISFNYGVLQPLPEALEIEYNIETGRAIVRGNHRGKHNAAVNIKKSVQKRYSAEDESDKLGAQDRARKDLAYNQTHYEERIFNDQCWLLRNMQSIHIKSKRGYDPNAKWGSGRLKDSSQGGPGPGSLSGQGQAYNLQGQPIDGPSIVGQADFPLRWGMTAQEIKDKKVPNQGRDLAFLGWPYRNFTVLRGDPHKVTNTLLAKELSRPLLDITPTELACLVPKIEFSKVFLGGSRGQNVLPESIQEVKFPFRTKSDITKTMLQKQRAGSGVGIESVSYTLQGANFATAKKLVDVKARFYFRSMKDFTDKITVPVTVGNSVINCTLSFMDLVAYARGLGPDPAKQLKAGDPSNFMLKLVLGWAVPSSSGIKKIIPNKRRRDMIKESIEESQLVLFLNCISFQYSFNDDGSMTADVTYGGYLENALDSLNLDIFELNTANSVHWANEQKFWDAVVEYFEHINKQANGEEVEVIKVKTTEENSPDKDIMSLVCKKYQISRSRLFNTVQTISTEAKVTDISWGRIANPGDDSYQAELEITSKSAEESLKEAEQRRQASLRENRGVRWRRLLEKILNKKETDIFTAYISQEGLTSYQEKISKGTALGPQDRAGFAKSRYAIEEPHFDVVTDVGFEKPNDFAEDTRAKATKNVLNAITLKKTKNRKKRESPSLHPSGDPYLRTGRSGGRNKGVYSIYFIYLGDIIEAAMEVLHDAKQKDQTYPKAKLLIGDFIPAAAIYGGTSVSLADIPISMDNFLNFFVEQVVEKDRDSYPLMTFIQDILEKLVKPLLANACDDKAYTGLDINSTYLMLKGIGEENEKNRIPNGRIHHDQLKKLVDKRGNSTPGWRDIKGYFHYLYLYADSPMTAGFNEDQLEDEKRKIYHLAIGRDRGLVKNASFKKRDVRGLEEARAFSERGANVNENILIPYHDVDIKLVGNTIFWPGMLFYLDPAFAGLGTTQTRRRIAHQLNIGGYYRVIKVDGTVSRDGFESTIDGTYIFNPTQREKRNRSHDMEEAKDLGMYED